jgi:pyruvate/2-oxoglutarate dehydrogenase complex dihydrolipoamide dehydrogenase (E3) component
MDAFEKSIELASTAVGQANEAAGHVTIVLDRGAGTLAGAFMSGPGAPDAIHMAVLAIKTRTPISILADTITAFPTTSRVMGGLFVEAARELRAGA